ncbi:GAF domain-containing sensor histidine kinase [Aliikangiella sp. G2MR2-5]|uniref:GAF domain-containing sensor histidine kinase n=1 Tax=Aliikangiella sp. G2MR2-5 TaxID=2788943 RepID=UPI0018AAB3B9|nr:GAF domain-containing sensor histidine kinase [Aliikangiella sp. G2MR2-5]
MQTPDIPENESLRLNALNHYDILDTQAEQSFDELTQIVADICGVPIALVSLVDSQRQWFKSKIGLATCETERNIAFCAHAILQPDIFIIENTLKDDRFSDNPLVTGSPNIRFYAGAPLITQDGFALGTLCVIDTKPRSLDKIQMRTLRAVANQVVAQLELRVKNKELLRTNLVKERILSILAHDLKNSFNSIIGLAKLLSTRKLSLGTDKVTEVAGQIYQSGDRAYSLLQNILDWSKTQNEDEHSESQAKISDIFDSVKQLTQAQAKIKSVEVIYEVVNDISVPFGKTLGLSAILNLVNNSIKFSNKGQKIEVSAQTVKNQYQITVSDKGKGMNKQQASQLFSGEVAASRKGTEGEPGTGLGSIFVYDFVKSIDGEITVDTKPELGCTVTITLPQYNQYSKNQKDAL